MVAQYNTETSTSPDNSYPAQKNIPVTLPKHGPITISIPIQIPTQIRKTEQMVETELDLTDQYSLNLNNFNPSKMSPPDSWRSRLELRLKNHYLLQNVNSDYDNNICLKSVI